MNCGINKSGDATKVKEPRTFLYMKKSILFLLFAWASIVVGKESEIRMVYHTYTYYENFELSPSADKKVDYHLKKARTRGLKIYLVVLNDREYEDPRSNSFQMIDEGRFKDSSFVVMVLYPQTGELTIQHRGFEERVITRDTKNKAQRVYAGSLNEGSTEDAFLEVFDVLWEDVEQRINPVNTQKNTRIQAIVPLYAVLLILLLLVTVFRKKLGKKVVYSVLVMLLVGSNVYSLISIGEPQHLIIPTIFCVLALLGYYISGMKGAKRNSSGYTEAQKQALRYNDMLKDEINLENED